MPATITTSTTKPPIISIVESPLPDDVPAVGDCDGPGPFETVGWVPVDALAGGWDAVELAFTMGVGVMVAGDGDTPVGVTDDEGDGVIDDDGEGAEEGDGGTNTPGWYILSIVWPDSSDEPAYRLTLNITLLSEVADDIGP
jgi:hypothetical protein